MHDSKKYLFPIIFLLAGLLICAACTQKDGPAPFTTTSPTPGSPFSPGQLNPGMTAGSCTPPQVWCNGRCADLSAERENCGACGALCPEGKICRNMQCVAGDKENPENPGFPEGAENSGIPVIPGSPVITGTTPAGSTTPVISGTAGSLSCSSGQINCYGTCTDLQSDATHCGACNIKCPSGKVCSAGSCTISCSAGLDNCGGSCTNTRTSSQHCGKCNNPCSSGQTCQNGKCGLYMSVATLDPHDICINSGKSWCWGVCSDRYTDADNCGSCGNKCPAGQTCQNAKCGVYASIMTPDAKQICAGSGKLWCSGSCTDQNSDTSNCGSCGNKCNSGEPCTQGKCLSWTGSWKSSKNTLVFVQTGTSVTETAFPGTLTGVTSGSPPTVKGSWTSFGESGTFSFSMAADGKTFSGTMWTNTGGSSSASYTRQ